MRRSGTLWPDQIANPGGFLTSRLRRLGSFTGRRHAATAFGYISDAWYESILTKPMLSVTLLGWLVPTP